MSVADGNSSLALYYAPAAAPVSPLFRLSAVPMLTASFDEAETLLRIARPYYEAALARHEQVLLATQPWRPGTLWSRQAIRSTADLAGKAFTLGPNAQDWGGPLKGLGVRQGGEAPDMVVAGGYTGNLDRFGRLYPNVSEIFCGVQLNFVTMNKQVFEALSETNRLALRAVGRSREHEEWQFNRNLIGRDHAEMTARGVSVSSPPPEELMAALRSAAEPGVQAWVGEAGSEGKEILTKYRQAIGRS